jgi:hypothetical protein
MTPSEAGQEFYCASHPTRIFCAPVLENLRRAAPSGASGSAQQILARPASAYPPGKLIFIKEYLPA